MGLEFWLPSSQLIPAIQSIPRAAVLVSQTFPFWVFWELCCQFLAVSCGSVQSKYFPPLFLSMYIKYTFSSGYSLSLVNLTSALTCSRSGHSQENREKNNESPLQRPPKSPLQRSPSSRCLLSMCKEFCSSQSWDAAAPCQVLQDGRDGISGRSCGMPLEAQPAAGGEGQQLSHTKTLRDHLIASLFSRAATPALWPGREL